MDKIIHTIAHKVNVEKFDKKTLQNKEITPELHPHHDGHSTIHWNVESLSTIIQIKGWIGIYPYYQGI